MTIKRMTLLVLGTVFFGSALFAVYPNWVLADRVHGRHLVQASPTAMWSVSMALRRIGLPSHPAFG